MRVSDLFEQNIGPLTMKEIEARMLKVITPLKVAASDKIWFRVRSPVLDNYVDWVPGYINIQRRTKYDFDDGSVLLMAAVNSLLRAHFPWLEVGKMMPQTPSDTVIYLRAAKEHQTALINRLKSSGGTWAVRI